MVKKLTFKQKFNRKHKQPLNKSNSIKDIAKKSGIKYSNARKIVQKGRGAFRTNPQSVRPQVKSATQWGIARLYASVSKGSKSGKIDKNLLK
jgi:hypothetical protein|tara:strand:- start:436 stop:711 length:276 start_codon:yes stop_codon:yes gene_type:complete